MKKILFSLLLVLPSFSFAQVAKNNGHNGVSVTSDDRYVLKTGDTMSGPLTLVSSLMVTGAGGISAVGPLDVDGAVDFDSNVSVSSITVQGNTNSVTIGDMGGIFPTIVTMGNSSGNLNIGKERETPTSFWGSGGLAWGGAITTTGAYPLQLGTNEIARLNILANGNVGIGNISPSTKLHVSTGVLTVDGTGAGITVPGMATSAGAGGLYVCIDNTGVMYMKSSCP